jgi:lipid-A-disaccharide synthase
MALRRSVDRMAVVLPFEAPIWRDAGIDAHYVGHPALETRPLDRAAARAALGMTPYAAAVAVLPGSRPHEVRRLLVPMLDAYERVRSDRASVDARVIVASSLDDATRRWLQALCASRRIATFDVDPRIGAMGVLRAFDATLCASGTASLEAALARAVPVIAYRVGLTTELAARMLLTTSHVALPNVLLGRRAFTELLQRDAHAQRIAQALADALDRRPTLVAACDAVEATLGEQRTPSVVVAQMLAPCLGTRARAA